MMTMMMIAYFALRKGKAREAGAAGASAPQMLHEGAMPPPMPTKFCLIFCDVLRVKVLSLA